MRTRFAASTLWMLTLAALPWLAAPAAAQDIRCAGTQQRFGRPGNCQRACTRSVGGIGGCFLVPRCTALDVQLFKEFYNRALFGIGRVNLLGRSGPGPNNVLVAFVINEWLKPNKYTDFNVVWGRPEQTEDWAHVEPSVTRGGKPDLTISPDAIWLSPAGLANALGHEMVHVEQLKRTYHHRLAGINNAVTSFRELEASTWETGVSNFPWSIGPSRWSGCLPQDEKQGSDATRTCRDWQVKKAIEDIRDYSRVKGDLMALLEAYMNDDPWIKQVWLPGHQDWKAATAGKAPQDCPNPH